jgi:hypothetical protein
MSAPPASRARYPDRVVPPKRRLPLIQATDGGSEGPPRAPWQWVGFGALVIFATWVPLSALVGGVAARLYARASDEAALGRAALMTSAGYAVALAVGALAGGYLVGRWGTAGVGVREAALAGATAAAALAVAVVATVVAGALVGATLGLLLLALMAPLMAALGGRLGVRGRERNR